MRTNEAEIALAAHFDYRQNIIVPNLSHGMLNHEADLIILSERNYCTEVEIKITKEDLKADFNKSHTHKDKLIHQLYYAFPASLKDCIPLIPEHAGIILIHDNSTAFVKPCEKIRLAVKNKNPKWTDEDRQALLRLAHMRIWSLKEKLTRERLKFSKVKSDEIKLISTPNGTIIESTCSKMSCGICSKMTTSGCPVKSGRTKVQSILLKRK